MEWMTPLKVQQLDFIQRLKTRHLLHCEIEGQHSELTVITGEKLTELRCFCWQMAEKYKSASNVRNIFINNLKGKLGEEAIKARLSNFITKINYKEQIGGDGKIDFTLTSTLNVGIQVKARHGQIDKVQWSISKEEIEKNSVLVCILILEDVNEAQPEYNLIFAGFLPTNLIKVSFGKFSCGIDELLYSGGLRSYLEYLKLSQIEYYVELVVNCLDKDDYKGASDICNKALQTNPECAELYLLRCLCHFYLGNYQKSTEDYNEALKINPNLNLDYDLLGLIRLIRSEEAWANYRSRSGK